MRDLFAWTAMIACLTIGLAGCEEKLVDDDDSTAEESPYQQLSLGYEHACLLYADGHVECWGENEFGQTDAPDGAFQHISTGIDFSCGVRVDGSLVCWGDNGMAQCAVPEGEFTMVATGGGQYPHACAIKASGGITCWGNNHEGQQDVPDFDEPATDITSGAGQTCALDASGTPFCWGWCGIELCEVPAGNYEEIQLGLGYHGCAADGGGSFECWGCSFDYGQCDTPAGNWGDWAVGGSHTCALDEQDELQCWGALPTDDFYGENYFPTGSWTYKAVEAGRDFTCVIKTSDQIVCFGNNDYGQLGEYEFR